MPVPARIVFECPIFEVEETDVRLPSGSTVKHWHIIMPDWVGVLCLRGGRIVLLREYRSASQSLDWGIVAGQIEEGETPQAAAAREVMEETGWEPLDLRLLTTFRHASPFIKMTRFLFLATQFRGSGSPEEGIEVHEFTPDRVEALLKSYELAEPREVYKAMHELAQGQQTVP